MSSTEFLYFKGLDQITSPMLDEVINLQQYFDLVQLLFDCCFYFLYQFDYH